MAQLIACALQLGGMPVPRGGGVRLVEALAGDRHRRRRRGPHGGRRRARRGRGGPRARRAARRRRAGARAARGDRVGHPERALRPPARAGARAGRGRGGRPALPSRARRDADPPRARRAAPLARRARGRTWRARRSSTSPPGSTGSRARSTRPSGACCPPRRRSSTGQPCALDPDRAPDGRSILWIQLQELPAGRVRGDAAGEIDIADGEWTQELREAYADRILRAPRRVIENLDSATLARAVLSPADLETPQRQPRRRRHLRRLVRARPEPRLAPVPAGPRPPHRRRRPVAHRRVDAPGARPRRRLGLSRGEGADRARAAQEDPPAAARLRARHRRAPTTLTSSAPPSSPRARRTRGRPRRRPRAARGR